MLTSKQIEQAVNQHRIQHKLRVLWPDYEVYDLIESNIHFMDLKFFTSNPIHIIKINNLSEQLQKVFSERTFTHMAIHKIAQLNQQLELIDTFYAILSKKGIAVDQLNCRFLRGNYLILANIAQIDRQISFWGVQGVAQKTTIVGPKSIVKKTSMWILQFQSSKPLKSILFYSIKREPRYGKNTFYENQLPKDVKLQYCMKIRIFTSYLQSLMDKEDLLLSDTFFLPSNTHKPIKFNKENNQEKEEINHSLPKQKVHETALQMPQVELKQQTKVKILTNSSFLQIFQMQHSPSSSSILQQIQSYIVKVELLVQNSIQKDTKIDENTKQTIKAISFLQLKSYSWTQITDLTFIAKQPQLKQLYHYLLAVKMYIFCDRQTKNIEKWIELYKQANSIQDVQYRQNFQKWGKDIMRVSCLELLKDCDDEIYDQLAQHKQLLIECITQSLQKHKNENGKISDLLYILMQVQDKKNVFDLYHAHRLTSTSLLLAPSLKMWEMTYNFHLSPNSDTIYQSQYLPSFMQYYAQPEPNSINNHKNQQPFDFQVNFSCPLNSKNIFMSGKSFTIGNFGFKYFIYRKQDNLYCFIEETHGLSSQILQPKFTSFEISIQMKINNESIKKQLGWSFISPSIAVGSKFTFSQIPKNADINCKISFKRIIIHDSILNYLRIKFEELVRLENKCSLKIEQENKKLTKRRSSLFLQKNLFPTDSYQPIQRQCFLHKICCKCQGVSHQISIYHLNPLDIYNLLLFAPFKQQADALLITLKYLIINPHQLINRSFWLSHIRIKYFNPSILLKIINKNEIPRQFSQIVNILIDEKIKQTGLIEKKLQSSTIFMKQHECRIGRSIWQYCESDYSEDYLVYITNTYSKI